MVHSVGTGKLFDQFMPHGMCYQWRPDILTVNVGSDALIALSYFLIPVGLLYYMRSKARVSYPLVVYLFCLFIFSCGVTHAFGIWTVWSGQYGIHGLIKTFTAAASVATVVTLYPLLPKLLALRTASDLEQEIEQRKHSERQALKLQDELARVGRVTTVGSMATGLAHEINQPLLAISASVDTAVQVAKSSPRNTPLLFECLDDILKDTHRAGEIIRTLRQFISDKTTTRSSVDVNKLIGQAIRLVSGDARSANIKLLADESTLPPIKANSVQIAQVLVNLLRNSVEALSGPSHEPQPGAEKIVLVKSRYDDKDVFICVHDNGPGIGKMRDPFTLFESQKKDGMGVGLSISRDIVEAHGGVLRYVSDQSTGTTFTFNLPTIKD